MTARDRCTNIMPHPTHSRFGLKDCPGVPMTPANAPTVPDGPAATSGIPRKTTTELGLADLERRVGQLEDRVDEHLMEPEYDPADDQAATERLIATAHEDFASANSQSERVEAIRDLLDGWYAAWPDTAVTDSHEPIAWELAALIVAAEARASAPASVPSRRAQEEPSALGTIAAAIRAADSGAERGTRPLAEAISAALDGIGREEHPRVIERLIGAVDGWDELGAAELAHHVLVGLDERRSQEATDRAVGVDAHRDCGPDCGRCNLFPAPRRAGCTPAEG